jgi:hypothetical protein
VVLGQAIVDVERVERALRIFQRHGVTGGLIPETLCGEKETGDERTVLVAHPGVGLRPHHGRVGGLEIRGHERTLLAPVPMRVHQSIGIIVPLVYEPLDPPDAFGKRGHLIEGGKRGGRPVRNRAQAKRYEQREGQGQAAGSQVKGHAEKKTFRAGYIRRSRRVREYGDAPQTAFQGNHGRLSSSFQGAVNEIIKRPPTLAWTGTGPRETACVKRRPSASRVPRKL